MNLFFQILWKNRCHILVAFPSHLKKLRSILRLWLKKLNCGFFSLVSLMKKHHNTTYSSCQNFSGENNDFFVTCRKVNVSKFFHNVGTLGTFASSRSSQNEYNIRFCHFNTVKTIKISPRCYFSNNISTFECSRYDDFRQRQQHVKWGADDSRDFSHVRISRRRVGMKFLNVVFT